MRPIKAYNKSLYHPFMLLTELMLMYQDGLRLLPQQKQAIYKARESLVGKLRTIAAERAHIVSQLGIQLLDFQRVRPCL